MLLEMSRAAGAGFGRHAELPRNEVELPQSALMNVNPETRLLLTYRVDPSTPTFGAFFALPASLPETMTAGGRPGMRATRAAGAT
jgi:hypothetical protein